MNRQAQDFEKGGGFSERLHQARTTARTKNTPPSF